MALPVAPLQAAPPEPVIGVQQTGGAGSNPADINFVGASQQDLQNYEQAYQGALDSLQQRVAAPNWWNVTAALLTPGPGGFLGSLGHASQALGQFTEQRRQMALPIAQVRTQLAQAKIAMDQNQQAANAWTKLQSQYTDPSQIPLDKLSSFVAGQTATAPNAPATRGAATLLQSLRETQGLQMQKQQQLNEQIQNELGLANTERTTGQPGWQQHLQTAQTLQGELRAMSQPYPAGSPVPVATGVSGAVGTKGAAGVAPPVLPAGAVPAATGAPAAPVPGGSTPAATPAAAPGAPAAPASMANPGSTQPPGHLFEFNANTGLGGLASAYAAGHLLPQQAATIAQDMFKRGEIDPQDYASLQRTFELDNGAAPLGAMPAPGGLPAPAQGAASTGAGGQEAAPQGPVIRLPSAVPPIGPTYTTPQAAEAQQSQIKQYQALGTQQYDATLNNQEYHTLDNLITSTQTLIHDNPQAAQAALGILEQKSGFFGGMLNALQGGASVHLGDVSAHMSLPVRSFFEGALTPQEKQLRSQIASKLSQISLMTQRMGGLNINANTARNVELHLSTAATANPEMQANAILYSLAALQNTASYNNMLRNRADAVANGTDTHYDTKGSPTAYYDFFGNQAVMSHLSKGFLQRQAQIDANFTRAIGGGKGG